jgi:hypothetical protein
MVDVHHWRRTRTPAVAEQSLWFSERLLDPLRGCVKYAKFNGEIYGTDASSVTRAPSWVSEGNISTGETKTVLHDNAHGRYAIHPSASRNPW